MPITVQFVESYDRDTLEEARGGAGPHRRAVHVSQPVEAKESQRFQGFVRSVKEKKDALEQGRISEQDAERIAGEEVVLEVGEDTEDEEGSPEETVAEVCASKRRPLQAAIDIHRLSRRKRRSLPYSWN
jgi:hypothetical protein